jgi:hypothetical protein
MLSMLYPLFSCFITRRATLGGRGVHVIYRTHFVLCDLRICLSVNSNNLLKLQEEGKSKFTNLYSGGFQMLL